MRVAALDLGSNTFLLLVAEVDGSRVTRVLHDEVQVVRLGQELFETGEFHIDALKRAENCLTRFSETIKKYSIDRVGAVATSAARDAKNQNLLFAITKKLAIPVEIISGDLEAKLTYLGGGGGSEDGICVIDVGGGSTEVVGKDSQGALVKHSFNLGSVRLTEKFISSHPVKSDEMRALSDFINTELERKSSLRQQIDIKKIVAVAGTPTTIADMKLGGGFVREKIENYFMSQQDFADYLLRLSQLSLEERLRIPGMSKGREDVIVAGMAILANVVRWLGGQGFYVSTKGVRYGLAIELASR